MQVACLVEGARERERENVWIDRSISRYLDRRDR